MAELPIIDISPLRHGQDDRRTAVELDHACRSFGFFLVAGHGVPADRLQELDRLARSFFELDEATKAGIAMPRAGRAWRGWFPEGGELTSGRPDHKEGLYFGAELAADDPRVTDGRPLHGPNQFPAHPAGLREAVLGWIDEMTELGHVLVRGLALGLGLAPDWFDEHLTADPTVLFRIFRYPARPPVDDGWGVAEHTDYGLVTILAHDGTPGLQVRSGGGWIDVPAVPDTFVVNLGDMLERMTSGRYRSTPHRVRHAPIDGSEATADRLSFPLFFDPGWEAEILPVPADAFGADDPPPDRAAIDAADRWDRASVHEWSGTYGDYLTAKVSKVFPDLESELHRDPDGVEPGEPGGQP